MYDTFQSYRSARIVLAYLSPQRPQRLEFLSRIVERTIRLKLTWACSEKREVGLFFLFRKSDQRMSFSVISAGSSVAGERW